MEIIAGQLGYNPWIYIKLRIHGKQQLILHFNSRTVKDPIVKNISTYITKTFWS